MTRRRFGLLGAAMASLAGTGALFAQEKPMSARPRLLHIAWLRFNPGVTQEQIDRHFAACRALVGKIPVVHDLQCGRNLSERADGMTHGIVVTLRDRDSIQAYLEHPEHVAVVTPFKLDVAALRVMDLEL